MIQKLTMLKSFFVTTLVLLCLGSWAQDVNAFEISSGEMVSLAADKDIDGSFYAVGQKIVIDGNVNGDLVCLGQEVIVNGGVEGDILCAAQSLILNGNVGGDIRLATQTLTLANPVVGNAHLLTQEFDLTAPAEIGGELAFVAQNASFWGRVGGDLIGSAETVSLNGEATRNVNLEIGMLNFGPEARIGGDLRYRATEVVSVDQGRVGGQVVPEIRAEKEEHTQARTPQQWLWSRITAILSYLLLAAAIGYFWPGALDKMRNQLTTRFASSFGVGLLGLILWPLLVIFFLVTIVGLPLALLIALSGGIVLLVAPIVPSIFLGQQLLMIFNPRPTVIQSALAGIPIAWLLFSTPVIGWALCIFATVLGWGAMLLTLKQVAFKRHG